MSHTREWLSQRFTAIALVLLAPLGLWVVPCLFSHPVHFKSPLIVLSLVLLIVFSCWHGWQGLKVIIEDYVHCQKLKTLSLIAVALIMISMVGIGILSVITLYMGALS